MLPGDARNRWDADVLADRRVIEFWDDELVTGTWFGRHLDEMGVGKQIRGVYWDAFLVFDKDARWETVPGPVVASGATVIGQRERLQAALAPLT
jgi:hypothetical protein